MDNRQKILDRFLAFSWGQLLDAANLIRFMRKNDIPGDDFLRAMDEALEAKKRQVQADAASTRVKPKPAKQKLGPKKFARQYPETLACPKCGHAAYSQPVCPGCAKGRAGIRREYICGECNFVFYID